MSLFIAIIGAIAAIFSIIILHELGHYCMARLCGIKIVRFSIGFGKALFKKVGKTGTEYIFAILPLGGYVKMLGEGEEVTRLEESNQAYNKKPLLIRMAVVAAGPLVNFLMAIVAFWGVYLMGVSHVKPVVGSVVPHSIAWQAGVKPGDELIKIDGQPVNEWQRVMMSLVSRMGDRTKMLFTVKPKNTNEFQQLTLDLSRWQINRRNPDFFGSLGFSPYQPKVAPIVANLILHSPAANAGFHPGDRIVAMNGKPVDDWIKLVQEIQKKPNQVATFTVKRDATIQTLSLKIGAKNENQQTVGYLGIISLSPQWPAELIRKDKYSLWTAWWPAIHQMSSLTVFNFVVMVKMITGKISVHSLGGPITVFQAAGQASMAGWQVYLGFIGFISLSIGFINLLPIPGLDGGHLLFQFIEGIFRKPVPERIQMIGLSIGMIFLIFLMVQATINDIFRLFWPGHT